MNEKQHFIMTSDEGTAKTLRTFGYPELPQQDGKWVFVNQATVVFSSDDMKMSYTDKLCF